MSDNAVYQAKQTLDAANAELASAQEEYRETLQRLRLVDHTKEDTELLERLKGKILDLTQAARSAERKLLAEEQNNRPDPVPKLEPLSEEAQAVVEKMRECFEAAAPFNFENKPVEWTWMHFDSNGGKAQAAFFGFPTILDKFKACGNMVYGYFLETGHTGPRPAKARLPEVEELWGRINSMYEHLPPEPEPTEPDPMVAVPATD